jgi:hypothetical protein
VNPSGDYVGRFPASGAWYAVVIHEPILVPLGVMRLSSTGTCETLYGMAASHTGFCWKRFARLPTAWFGDRNVTVNCFEPQVEHLRRGFTLITGKFIAEQAAQA